MAEPLGADLITVRQARDGSVDLGAYDLVGFASGIYFGGVDKGLGRLVDKLELRRDQRTFLVFTCGAPPLNFARRTERALRAKASRHLGHFACRGYDTFGPWAAIGGIAKGHPSEADLRRAKRFATSLLEQT